MGVTHDRRALEAAIFVNERHPNPLAPAASPLRQSIVAFVNVPRILIRGPGDQGEAVGGAASPIIAAEAQASGHQIVALTMSGGRTRTVALTMR